MNKILSKIAKGKHIPNHFYHLFVYLSVVFHTILHALAQRLNSKHLHSDVKFYFKYKEKKRKIMPEM